MLKEMLTVVLLSSGTIEFNEAKIHADRDEATLHAPFSSNLVESQGKVAGPAFAACIPSPPPSSLPSFTIVFVLDSAGKAQKTWLKGDSQFATCVRDKFAVATFFIPPKAPFYSSFDFKFKP
jgi:hypothetical protein